MPKLPPSKFQPEFVSTLNFVLNAAVGQIDVAHRTPATKAKMAERLLRGAAGGITDPGHLKGDCHGRGQDPSGLRRDVP